MQQELRVSGSAQVGLRQGVALALVLDDGLAVDGLDVAGQPVVPGPEAAGQLFALDEDVLARTTVEEVLTRPADQHIVTVAAVDRVVTVATDQDVVTVVTVQD